MMKIKMLVLGVFGAVSVTACANTGAAYTPITDGPVNANYNRDLSACQNVAEQRAYVNADTKTNAMIGAGIGALAGLADDDVSDTEGAIGGAIVGAAAGGGSTMLETREQRRQIVIECMKGRGHPVVG